MSEFVYKRPILYPKQLNALFNDKRYALCEATTKSGKTHACLVWIFEKALQLKPGQQAWWLAPTYRQAEMAWDRLLRAIPEDMRDSNKTDLTIKLKNGAIVRFLTGERPDNLYGDDVYAAIVDEASRVRPEAWHALRSTLTATGGHVRIIGNVKGKRNWFYAMARAAERGAPNMSFARLTAYDAIDAGIFGEGELEEARSMLPEKVFRELYMAEAADDEGNPFGTDFIEACLCAQIPGRPNVCSNNPVVAWGIDLAKSVDYTVLIGLDHEGHVCRFLRFKDSWETVMTRIVAAVGTAPALVDSTGVGDPILEQLRIRGGRNFEGFTFTSTSKQRLMEGLAVAIQEKQVRFPEGVIVEELHAYEYVYTRTGVRYEAADGYHDDTVCALALAVQAKHNSTRRGKIPMIPALGGGSKPGHSFD